MEPTQPPLPLGNAPLPFRDAKVVPARDAKVVPARDANFVPAGDANFVPAGDANFVPAGDADVIELAAWRARRDRAHDVEMGAPPFVLEEPCPGCGAERVATMVWRDRPGAAALPMPRLEPHFECREGRVLHQDITDAPIPLSAWSSILGRFREEVVGGGW